MHAFFSHCHIRILLMYFSHAGSSEKNAKTKFVLLICRESHFSHAGVRKNAQIKFPLFTYRGVQKNAKRKFAVFTCRGSEKMLKESLLFSLAAVTLFTRNGSKIMSEKSSHFSLAGYHTFHLHRVRKNAKRRFALFTCRQSEKNASIKFSVDTTSNNVCHGVAHQKLKLSVHTEHKRAVAR